jgi:hypothetical protein
MKSSTWGAWFFAFALIALIPHPSWATNYLSQTSSPTDTKHYLLAENDMDDSYDPFSDYSEFDEASDEEADINFFRNGRFFTVGFAVGMRGFTENLNELYSSGPAFGLFLSYFFDLRLALELGFQTGDHDFQIATATERMAGNVSLTFINMNLKYYLNTQNVTRGLADLNPYILGGFSQVYRTYTLEGADVASREATVGVNGGIGIEIPLMRRKAFFGTQATYHYVNFRDENSDIVNSRTGTNYGVKPKGDIFDIVGILGLSF